MFEDFEEAAVSYCDLIIVQEVYTGCPSFLSLEYGGIFVGATGIPFYSLHNWLL